MERDNDKKDEIKNTKKTVLETEDLFGDKDSDNDDQDDDDPTAETFLESRSINVNVEINKNEHAGAAVNQRSHGDNASYPDRNVDQSSSPLMADVSHPSTMIVIKEEPGQDDATRLSSKRGREE